MGYTQVSWTNTSRDEELPASIYKYWAKLTESEQTAAELLGYNATIWDNDSGSEPQPASASKLWHELTTCGEMTLTRARLLTLGCWSMLIDMVMGLVVELLTELVVCYYIDLPYLNTLQVVPTNRRLQERWVTPKSRGTIHRVMKSYPLPYINIGPT